MNEDKSTNDESIDDINEPESTNDKPAEPIEKPKKSKSFPTKLVFVIVLLMLASAGATYYWQSQQSKKDIKAKNAEIAAQQKKIEDLQKEIDELKAAAVKEDTASGTETSSNPSAKTLENIKAAISSKNYAALEQNMADSVYVIIAASEFAKNRTPVEAINDLKYFDSVTGPWDFALPAATLSAYASGDYASYFPTSAYVGKAASGQVVSFQFDSSGKIKTVFISATDVL